MEMIELSLSPVLDLLTSATLHSPLFVDKDLYQSSFTQEHQQQQQQQQQMLQQQQQQCRGFPLADLIVCVQEHENRPILLSYVLAPYSFVPYGLLLCFLVSFLRKRTSFPLLAAVFEVGLAIFNEGIIKNIIKQPRPLNTCACGYGMPSGHAAIASAFIVWFSLEIVFNDWKLTQFFTSRLHISKPVLILLLLFSLLPTAYTRVYLRYHTIQQVMVGSVMGGVLGALYFLFLIYFLSGKKLDQLISFINNIIEYLPSPFNSLSIKNNYPPRLSPFILASPLMTQLVEIKVV